MPSKFPPIAEYAFLSDCHTTALMAPDGSIEWMCLPRPDGPSVFGALLDRTAGFFRVGPAHVFVPAQRHYVPGSLVVETMWATPTGWLVVRDALIMGPWRREGRPPGYLRPPGDFVAQHVLVRSALCIDGHVDVEVQCMPQFDYGRAFGMWEYSGEGYESARCAVEGQPELTLRSNFRLSVVGLRAAARMELREGESAYVALSWDGGSVDDTEQASRRIEETIHHWRRWLQHARIPDHPWRPYLVRSALTLKGLSYAPTGAIMAASTTSLPETLGGERNWDYRYTWVRDSAFMLWALFELGFDDEAYHYFFFLMDTVAQGPLQIMYGLGGERDLTEETLDHLSGYEGSRPVRLGNGAYDQRQHDVWGMLVDAAATHVAQALQMGPYAWGLIVGLVDRAIEAWREPDRGIWEVRGEPKHFVSSKVMCWVAVDRGIKLAAERGHDDLVKRWQAVADEMQAEICDKGVDERGAFVQHYGTKALDASSLLVAIMGFLPPDDPRVRATVLAVADELTDDGLVLRYRTDETDDGMEGVEGTFTICSFWLVSCLALIGEVERATALCAKLLSFASPLHLYAEEIEASSGQHLGNFPQAFTHLALIDAVLRVIDATAPAS